MDDSFIYPEATRAPSPTWEPGAKLGVHAESLDGGVVLDLSSPSKRRRLCRPMPREAPIDAVHTDDQVSLRSEESSDEENVLDLAPRSKRRLLCHSAPIDISNATSRCKTPGPVATSTIRAAARAAAAALPFDNRKLYARSKVFAVTELTTLLLDHLPPRDLLVLQSVNRKLRDLITTLPNIAVKLGFTEKPLPRGYFPAEMTASILDFVPRFVTSIGFNPVTGMGFAVFDRVDLEFNPDLNGSWRQMMPFQPATMFMKMRGVEHYCDEIPRRIEAREKGVRLGDMVDALLKEHAADVDLYIAFGQAMMPLSFVFEIADEELYVENSAD